MQVWAPAIFAPFVVYGLTLFFAMLNQHFDHHTAHVVAGVVDSRFERRNPLPISVIGVRLASGRHVNVDVLPETWNTLNIGSPVEIVQMPGALGKTWYQDKPFFESLEGSRTFQGCVHIGLALIYLSVMFLLCRHVFKFRAAILIMLALVATGYGCFRFVL